MKGRLLLVATIAAVAVAPVANAAVYTVKVGDTHNYWLDDGTPYDGTFDNWISSNAGPDATKQKVGGGTTTDDNYADVIGDPNYVPGGLTANLNEIGLDAGFKLESLVFKYGNNDTHKVMLPGDVFLDIGNDFVWDYVFKSRYGVKGTSGAGSDEWTVDQVEGPSGGLEKWTVYALDNTTDTDLWQYGDKLLDPGHDSGVASGSASSHPYELAEASHQRDGTDGWGGGWDIRTEHPWQVDPNNSTATARMTSIGTADFSGLQYTPSGVVPATFDNFSLSSAIDPFSFDPDTMLMTVAWTVNCANDVIYEPVTKDLGQIIPEPTSLVTWSLLTLGGAAALGAVRRRKKRPGRWSEANRQAIYAVVERGR
jgi:hypothetical protein